MADSETVIITICPEQLKGDIHGNDWYDGETPVTWSPAQSPLDQLPQLEQTPRRLLQSQGDIWAAMHDLVTLESLVLDSPAGSGKGCNMRPVSEDNSAAPSSCLRIGSGLSDDGILLSGVICRSQHDLAVKGPLALHDPGAPEDRDDQLSRLSYMLEEVDSGKPMEQVVVEMRHSTFVQSLALARKSSQAKIR